MDRVQAIQVIKQWKFLKMEGVSGYEAKSCKFQALCA